jgi:Na+/proline symporter
VNLQTFCKFSWGTALSYSPFTLDLRSSLLSLDNDQASLSLFSLTRTLDLSPVTILFALGIVAASFSSADSALTSLTTSYCVDIRKRTDDERLRKRTHLIICGLFVVFILLFHVFNSTSLIDAIYTIVSYTYGPLLGLFAFGLFTKRQVRDRLVPLVCVASPFVCYGVDTLAQRLWDYHFGYELLMLNGLLTFLGLLLLSRSSR